jgi:hypothetical protein
MRRDSLRAGVMVRMVMIGMVREIGLMVMVIDIMVMMMKKQMAMMIELAVLWRGKGDDLQQQQQQGLRLGGEVWQVGQAVGAGRDGSSRVQMMQLVVVAAAGPPGLQRGRQQQQQQQQQQVGKCKAPGEWH